MQHLIIGAGPAGVVAAETLRKCDPDADIAIIGDEPEPPYSRMAIPYYLIDNVEESGTYLRDPAKHFKDLNIEVVQQKADQVDCKKKEVRLADGSSRAYDKLLIATGSKPISPPIPGLDLPQVHSCWTLEDARNIIKLAQSGSNVVLIGAGFIGCIILEALVKRGLRLTEQLPAEQRIPAALELLHLQFAARSPDREGAARQVRELADRALDLGLTRELQHRLRPARLISLEPRPGFAEVARHLNHRKVMIALDARLARCLTSELKATLKTREVELTRRLRECVR